MAILAIFVFCSFLVCRLSSSTEVLKVVEFGSFKAYFIELTFLKLSSKFHLDLLRIDRVTILLLSAIYLNDKSAYFGSITVFLLFPLHPFMPAIPIFL